MRDKYILKGRDRDPDTQWASLAVLDNGKVVGQVVTWIVGSDNCSITARTKDFKQYLLDNFQDNLEPTTQRFYFKTHSQKQLTKITTEWPLSTRQAATFAVRELLPTPPLPLMSATLCLIRSSRARSFSPKA